MRLALIACGLASCAAAQTPAASEAHADWRRALMGLPDRPPANTSVGDIRRFEESARMAAVYCALPGDYEANREMVQRMTAYLAALNTAASDPQLRMAVLRASRLVAMLPCVPRADQPETAAAVAPQKPNPPPFVLEAPEIENVAEADKATARDLSRRYESAATDAATAWQSAEVLRQNLAAEGMALNTSTAASLARLQLFLEEAAEALRNKQWTEAATGIERTSYEADKVLKTVGR